MQDTVKVAVDAMGGDNAPLEIVKGAVEAVNEREELHLFLVGNKGKIEAELAELKKKIEEYRAILSDKNKLLTVIKTEISLIAEKYGDERRTSIGYDEYDKLNYPDNVICMLKNIVVDGKYKTNIDSINKSNLNYDYI